MHTESELDTAVYKVVVSQEAQYSIWPAYKTEPYGWSVTDKQGSMADCLAYIEETWDDMRPKSLKDKMAQLQEA